MPSLPNVIRRFVAACVGHPDRTISVLFAGCVALFLLTLAVPRVDGLLIGSDGISYYAGLRSLALDHDLQLTNEYQRLTGVVLPGAETPKFGIGMSLVWLPFFLVAHLGALLAQALGWTVATDGYSWLYQTAICLGSMLYGYAGLLLIRRLCSEWTTPAAALAATLLVWFGWNVVYYLVLENSMAHAVSLFLVAALLWWWRSQAARGRLRYALGLGALVALLAMVRPQDVLFALLPAVDLLVQVVQSFRQGDKQHAWQQIQTGLLVVLATAVIYSPQLLTSALLYGNPLASGYLAKGESFNWTRPQLLAVLFSTWHGLISWHPLIAFALLGLGWFVRQQRWYGLGLLVMVLLQVYIVAAWHTWWQGDAFGSRMLINCAPVFALGLAYLLDQLHAQRRAWLGWSLSAAALVWNGLFILQYRLDFISKSEPITWRELTIDKLTVLSKLIQRVLT